MADGDIRDDGFKEYCNTPDSDLNAGTVGEDGFYDYDVDCPPEEEPVLCTLQLDGVNTYPAGCTLSITNVGIEIIDGEFRLTVNYTTDYDIVEEFRLLDDQSNVIFDWQTSNIFEGPEIADGSSYTIEARDALNCTATTSVVAIMPVNAELNNYTTGFTGRLQRYTFPRNGTYKLTAMGAQGGVGSPTPGIGGKGARMSGEFDFVQGDKLIALIGQQGADDPVNPGAGGGTFIMKDNSNIETFFDLENATAFGNIIDNSDASAVNTVTVRTTIKTTTSSNQRLLNTPGDEAFSVYFFNGDMSINVYGDALYNAAGAYVADNAWHDIEWRIDFAAGICTFHVDGSQVDSFSFVAGQKSWSQLEWLQRDGTYDLRAAAFRTFEIDVNGSPYLRYDYFGINSAKTAITDDTGNSRNITLQSAIPTVAFTAPSISESDVYLIAGGGGATAPSASNNNQAVADATDQPDGKDGFGTQTTPGAGGVNGLGGDSDSGNNAGGGGGLKGDSLGPGAGGTPASGFLNGGFGEDGPNGDGGYGSAGAGGTSGSFGTAPGGGGYSGGGGGYAGSANAEGFGGGAGSYPGGTNQDNEGGYNEGHGKLLIERVA